MNLKKQLKAYLDRQEISPAQLSKKSGVSKQVLSLWLAGGSPKNIKQVKDVAEILGTTVDHLCFGDGLEKKHAEFNSIPEDEWLSGCFEIKFRRIKG